MTHHLTNWIGDDGFPHRSKSRIRRHNPEGDTLFIDGEVAAKRVDGDRNVVEIAHQAANQDGELSIEGTAEVWLPGRG